MKIDFAFLCDHADAGKKLNAMGIGIDTLYLHEVPGTHAGFVAVIQIRFDEADVGDKTMAAIVAQHDGEELARMEGVLEVYETSRGAEQSLSRILMSVKPFPVKAFGAHSVIWESDGCEIHRIPFRVAEPKEMSPPEQQGE